MRTQGQKLASIAVVATALGLFAATRGIAATYNLAVDVPSKLGGTDFKPEQIVRSANGAYSVQAALPAGVALLALHEQEDGSWLFAPAHSVTLGGVEYEPRDLVHWNGSTYAMVFDGSTLGVPADARIDALMKSAGGNLVLSFDVPVSLGGVDFGRSDLVLYASGPTFSTYWDAEGPQAGVPASSNVIGAALAPSGDLVVTFDVPTTIGASTFLPGTLVRWTSGGGFSSYITDASWPPSSQLRDFAFLPPAGAVGSSQNSQGGPLLVSRVAGGNIKLAWGQSCSAGDTDFEIYEGTIGGQFTSHTARFCSTSSQQTMTFLPAPASSYYLVVPRNVVAEGSYGFRSNGSERPQGGGACLPQSIAACTP